MSWSFVFFIYCKITSYAFSWHNLMIQHRKKLTQPAPTLWRAGCNTDLHYHCVWVKILHTHRNHIICAPPLINNDCPLRPIDWNVYSMHILYTPHNQLIYIKHFLITWIIAYSSMLEGFGNTSLNHFIWVLLGCVCVGVNHWITLTKVAENIKYVSITPSLGLYHHCTINDLTGA